MHPIPLPFPAASRLLFSLWLFFLLSGSFGLEKWRLKLSDFSSSSESESEVTESSELTELSKFFYRTVKYFRHIITENVTRTEVVMNNL